MKKASFSKIAILLLLLMPINSSALFPTYLGTQQGFWDEHAVVVVRIGKIPSGIPPTDDFTIATVQATVFTFIIIPTSFKLHLYASSRGLPALHKGDLALLCVRRSPNGDWWASCDERDTFMPEPAQMIVTGIDDKTVLKTSQAIQQLMPEYWKNEMEAVNVRRGNASTSSTYPKKEVGN